jgi:hypothetical protein
MRRTRIRKGRLSLGSTFMVAATVLSLAGLSALPAAAEVYHLKLRNGTSIDTAYQPKQASWDPSMVLFLTDAGNWVGIPQKDVESVQSESQVRGYGVALNFNTVAIGWAPNDAPEATAANAQSAAMQALQNIMQRQEEESHYTIPQFVSTDQTQGIPARFVGIAPGMPAPQPQAIPIPIPVPSAASAPASVPPSVSNQ